MKYRRLLLFVPILLLLPLSSAKAVDLQVLKSEVLAPGVDYQQLNFAGPDNIANVVRIAVDAPVDIKPVTAGVLTPVSTLCNGCLLAVNASFFDMKTGQAKGDLLADGRLIPGLPTLNQLNIDALGRLRLGAIAADTVGSVGASMIVLKDGVVQRLADFTSMAEKPRTVAGWDAAGNHWFVTVDGRHGGDEGVQMSEVAMLLRDMGATNAVSLDGGGSSTFVVHGQVVNRPSDVQGERPVANALVVTLKPAPVPPPAVATPDSVLASARRNTGNKLATAGPADPALATAAKSAAANHAGHARRLAAIALVTCGCAVVLLAKRRQEIADGLKQYTQSNGWNTA